MNMDSKRQHRKLYRTHLKECNFSLDPLRKYVKETIVIELAGDLTIFNIDWFSVFDLETKENLGSIIIPEGLNVPPSLVKIIVRNKKQS